MLNERRFTTLTYWGLGVVAVSVFVSSATIVKYGPEMTSTRQEMVRLVRENDGSTPSKDNLESLSLEQWADVYERADVDLDSIAPVIGGLILPRLSNEDMKRVIRSYEPEARE